MNLLKIPGTLEIFHKIYGNNSEIIDIQNLRYQKLINLFTDNFFRTEIFLFSSPGRIEIGGNHTDHNAGKVLAAAINLDSIAAVSKTKSNIITVYSEGYPEKFIVKLDNLKPVREEKATTAALIRGIAARFKQLGLSIGGFNAVVSSEVLPGSGLSSSASIEVLFGTILNYLFNDGKISPVIIANICQYAENVYFGKPCGLMDQLTSAVGGIISIDFADSGKPVVKKVNFDFNSSFYKILVVDTGGNHADLTDDYASIPEEMKSIAKYFGKNVLRELDITQVLNKAPDLRNNVGDRALLRSLHFYADTDRVTNQVKVLQQGDLSAFLNYINESGSSSWKMLQNCYTTKNIREQGISLALAVSENFFVSRKIQGACRVHGGGFAGTILVFLPDQDIKKYVDLMEKLFGKNSVHILRIRSIGAVLLN